MKNILVPTDFSETSKCAFFYARRLAEALGGANISLVHVFMPAVESEYPNFVPPVSEFLKVRKEMLKEFREEACNEAEEPSEACEVEEELLIGFPADEIGRVSADYDLIVMGTTGDSDLLNKIFGSVSSAVARRADAPVILIPRDMEFKGFNNILYASNYESAEEDMVEELLEFNRPFNACIHFVHVREEQEKEAYEKSKEEIFEELFEDGEPGFSFQMAEVSGKSVAEGLNDYATENQIDLAVMVNHRRNFWENFLHKSQTKRMALTSRIPLMVLHLKEED